MIEINIPKRICKSFDRILNKFTQNFIVSMTILMVVMSIPFLVIGVSGFINNESDFGFNGFLIALILSTIFPIIFYGMDFLEKHISISCRCEDE